MTRRIAIAILITVWATLIAGSLTAYWTTRAVLLADLDDMLVARAMSLPELVAPDVSAPTSYVNQNDHYLIRNEIGQTIASLRSGPGHPLKLERLNASFFSQPGGARGRSVTLRMLAMSKSGKSPVPVPVTVTYRSSCEQFDSVLNRLMIALASFGTIAGLAAAGVAVRVSQATLRPLYLTAEKIAEIDDRRLNQRIDVRELPTELVPVAARLNEMLDRLALSADQRQQFLADTSHELRTPVAALTAALEVALRRPRDAESYRATLQFCLTDVKQLHKLVERLMEQVRSETIRNDELVEEIDVTQLLEECANTGAALGTKRDITVVRAIESGIRLKTYPIRLWSVVMNVLANAVEHNRPGGQVEISCERDGQEIRITVRDNGPGIPAEDLPHVFEPFYRVEKVHGTGSEHLGLGLTLVQAHVKTLGGICQIESQQGVGTVFRIQFPKSYPTTESSSAAAPAPASVRDPDPADEIA